MAPACADPADRERVLLRDPLGEDARAHGRPHARRRLEVLERDRQALERSERLAASASRVARPRLVPRAVECAGGDRVQHTVHGLDPGDVRVDDLERARLAPVEDVEHLEGGAIRETDPLRGHGLDALSGRLGSGAVEPVGSTGSAPGRRTLTMSIVPASGPTTAAACGTVPSQRT